MNGEGAPGEFGLIAQLFAPLAAGYPGALDLKDDAAFISPEPGREMVVTMDTMVAGVHFLPDDPPDLIARKLVRVNLSDLAAKGAVPRLLMLSAAFPQGTGSGWLQAFGAGLAQDVRAFGLHLIGGDTVSTPGPLTLTLAAFGSVEAGRGLKRSGGKAGDTVWVTGSLGDGALGLRAIRGQLSGLGEVLLAFLAGRYRLPQPRTTFGPGLMGLASAAMDVSDGLVQDLGHLARASGLEAVIEVSRLPLSEAAGAALAADQSLLALVLAGGDDYELLFAAPPGAEAAIRQLAAGTGVAVAAIGHLAAGLAGQVRVLDGAGAPVALDRGGWSHF